MLGIREAIVQASGFLACVIGAINTEAPTRLIARRRLMVSVAIVNSHERRCGREYI